MSIAVTASRRPSRSGARGSASIGRHVARTQAMGVLNLRSAYRAVAAPVPVPVPQATSAKLLLSERILGLHRDPLIR